MLGAIIQRLILKEIEKQAAGLKPVAPPDGYNPLAVIRSGIFHWVPVPFNGVPVWMELRTLNQSQLDAAGAVTLLEIAKDNTKPTREQLIEIRNKQEAIIKQVCNRPLFDDIVKELFDSDFVASENRKKLEHIKSIDMTGMSTDEKQDIADSIYNLELSLAFIIPEDAFGFLTAWALGVDVSNIKKVTREMLLEAAILATNGHDNPHDHIKGVFTDRDMGDIDKTAWGIYQEYQKEKEIEKNSKHKFIKTGRG